MDRHLDHRHELILESLVAGSLPRNLAWSDVIELIGKMGTVEPHGDNEFAFVVGSQRAFFKRPNTHSLEVDEVARLRRFLREAGQGQAEPASKSARPLREVAVIDHHLARVYQDIDGSRPQEEDAVRPYDPHGFHRHLIHRKEAHYQGERVPEDRSFYEEVAKDLAPAQEIVLIGHGTGKSSALVYLVEELKKNHPTVYQRVIATEIVDLSALTEAEIEAIAKRHM
jgi:hypothetical protein